MKTRRSIFNLVASAFAFVSSSAYALPQKETRKIDLRKCVWGREVVVCDGKCSFMMLPLIDGHGPDSLVHSLSITHIFYGSEELCSAMLIEQGERHVGRSAALLAVMSPRENNYW